MEAHGEASVAIKLSVLDIEYIVHGSKNGLL